MALVVASTSSASTSNTNSLVVTKPASVASGDLLLMITHGDWVATNGNWPTLTGFTRIQEKEQNQGSDDANVALYYKIADSGDVSASNYTISYPGGATAGAAAVMMRVTGWTTGNPIYTTSDGGYQSDGDATVNVSGLSLARPVPQLLLIFGASRGAENYVDFGIYQITSSDSNPSWTEVAELDIKHTSDGVYSTLFVAYANSSNTSTITAYGFQHTASTSGGSETVAHCLTVIAEPTNATADIGHLAAAPTLFGLAGSNSTTANIGHLDTLPTINGMDTSEYPGGSRWTNPDKSSSTWTNPDK